MKLSDLKTFEDACKVEGLDATKVIPDLSVCPEKIRESTIAYIKLTVITSAANRLVNDGKEWTPDWDNSKELKYYPWFYMGSSGFQFRDYVNWYSISSVGSRLCFISEEVCEYVATEFIDLYKAYML